MTIPNRLQPPPTRERPRRAAIYAMAASIALAAAMPFAALADTATDTSCTPVHDKLAYFCEVMVTVDGELLSGAQIAQRADMPSMPLAHNVAPTRPAEIPDKPGYYGFEVALEMFGGWLFTYALESPIRDQVHEKIEFLPGLDSVSEPTSTDESTPANPNTEHNLNHE